MAKTQPQAPIEPTPPTAEPAKTPPAETINTIDPGRWRSVEDRVDRLEKNADTLRDGLQRIGDDVAAQLARPLPGDAASSPTIGQVVAALAKAQAAIKNPTKDKSAKIATTGGASYSYDYADLATVLDVVRPALAAQGLAIVQTPEMPDARTVAVRTVVAHASGEWIACRLVGTTADPRPQSIGSLITYLRRYGIQALSAIAAEADDDASTAQGVKAEISSRAGIPRGPRAMDPPSDVPFDGPAGDADTVGTRDGGKISQAQRTRLNAIVTERAKALGVSRPVVADQVKAYLKTLGVESSADLPRGRYDEVVKFAELVRAEPREPGADDGE